MQVSKESLIPQLQRERAELLARLAELTTGAVFHQVNGRGDLSTPMMEEAFVVGWQVRRMDEVIARLPSLPYDGIDEPTLRAYFSPRAGRNWLEEHEARVADEEMEDAFDAAYHMPEEVERAGGKHLRAWRALDEQHRERLKRASGEMLRRGFVTSPAPGSRLAVVWPELAGDLLAGRITSGQVADTIRASYGERAPARIDRELLDELARMPSGAPLATTVRNPAPVRHPDGGHMHWREQLEEAFKRTGSDGPAVRHVMDAAARAGVSLTSHLHILEEDARRDRLLKEAGRRPGDELAKLGPMPPPRVTNPGQVERLEEQVFGIRAPADWQNAQAGDLMRDARRMAKGGGR